MPLKDLPFYKLSQFLNKFFLCLIITLPFFVMSLAQAADKREVVIYTSLDQVFSEPILKEFEKQTGISVKVVYDVEAAKTTGLVNRLIAEKNNPRADVFWNSETARTIVLKKNGVLAAYSSKNAQDIPDQFKDPEGYWTGFAARARVLITNTDLLDQKDAPASILELTQSKWADKVVMAYPFFGTTAAQAAALFAYWGDQKAEQYFRDLKANGMMIVDGNSTSRDRVQQGVRPIGFTDTDDAHVALVNDQPVNIVFPDQGEGQMGTLLIPNTAALIKGGPNSENGKLLIDYLLSKETESKLAFADGAQIPLRDDVQRPEYTRSYQEIKTMDVNFEEIADKIEYASRILQKIFMR